MFGGLLAGCDPEVEIPTPATSQSAGAERPKQAQATLERLAAALQGGVREDAEELAAPGARQLMGWVHDNVADLRIGELSLRYVAAGAPLDAASQEDVGSDAWRGTVQVDYRFDGYDESPARLETGVLFVPTSDGIRIASFGGPGQRTPLWLSDRLSVVRTPETLLAVAGDPPGRYAGLVTRALTQVRRVLPAWKGPLVVEVPDTRGQFEAAVQSEPGQYDNIAAVTTTADGSLSPGAPVRVFINPDVFGTLEPVGAQVVMTHESTHVATGATFSSMPTWLLEGFADYVALDAAKVPLDLAAGQILARIREHGLPRGLPANQDLGPTADGLEASYEEAWLACRFLAQHYGTDRLVQVYRKVSDGAPVEDSFRSELGTTQKAFVTRWHVELARLAGVAR